MVLTPTYYVFQMYKDFLEATYLPMDVKADSIDVEGGHMYKMTPGGIPAVSISAAKKTYVVKPVNFKDAKLKKNTLRLSLPAKSVVVVNVK